MTVKEFDDFFKDDLEDDEFDFTPAIPTTANSRFSKKKKYTYGSGLWGKREWTGLSDFWRNPWRSTKNDDPRTIGRQGKSGETKAKPILTDVDAQLMAKHLRSIRSTSHLVFSRRNVNIQWASEDVSYTDIEGGNIRVSPAPLLTVDPIYDNWTVSQRLDVCHGLTMHEAAHNAHTPHLAKRECLKKGGMLLSELFNIFEDVYIEHQVEEEFPGFADYFDAKDDYYFTHQNTEERIDKLAGMDLTELGTFPDKTDPEYQEKVREQLDKLGAVINVLIPYIRHRSGNLDKLRTASSRHERAADVIEKAKENGDLLRRKNLDIKDRIQVSHETMIDLLSMFKDIPPEEFEDQSEDIAGEFEKAGLGEALREIFRQNGVDESTGNTDQKKGGATPVGAEDEPTDEELAKRAGRNRVRVDALDENTMAEIESFIEADLREMKIEEFETGYAGELITKVTALDMVRLPYADIRYAILSKQSKKHTRRLMNVLKFRAEDRIYKEREREHGKVDATRLTNLKAFKSPEIFYQTIKAEAPKVHIGILVDESGSMRSGTEWGMANNSRKMDVAVLTTIMMANALEQVHSVTYEIWGHSGDMYGTNREIKTIEAECAAPIRGAQFHGPTIMRYLDSRAGMTDARVLGRIAGRGNNYDGLAIEAVGNHMIQNAPNDRKVMFVICDGMPSGGGYGGQEAAYDVRDRNKKLRKQGVEVISIFVGSLGSAKAQMEIMYGKQNKGWLHCPNAADLPQLVEKVSSKLLKWEGK